MKKVLIIGAGGGIAQLFTDLLLAQGDANLTLFLRKPGRLHKNAASESRVIEGDALDKAALQAAVKGQDIVYTNLAGDPEASTLRKNIQRQTSKFTHPDKTGIHDIDLLLH